MTYTEIEKQRRWNDINVLSRQRSLSVIRQARQMLRDWMLEHPEDIASADVGEELAMLEEALESSLAKRRLSLSPLEPFIIASSG